MGGRLMVYIDQYGEPYWARTVKELRSKCGGGCVSKMYVDRAGETYHVGYVVGNHWCTAYAPVEVRQV